MERPRIKYLANVPGFSYIDVADAQEYWAWLEQENKRLADEVEYWKRYTMMPR
jgi:hypothetical protein